MHLLSPALCSVHVASIKVENVKLLKIFSSNIFIIFMGKQATSIILTNVDFSSDFQCDKVCQQTKLSLQDFF